MIRLDALLLVDDPEAAPRLPGALMGSVPPPAGAVRQGRRTLAVGRGHGERELARQGPFWPSTVLNRRGIRLLGREVVVAEFPIQLEFDILAILESDAEDHCAVQFEILDEDRMQVAPITQQRVLLHPRGSPPQQSSRSGIVRRRLSFTIPHAATYTVIAHVNTSPSGQIDLLVRLPAGGPG